ESLLDFLLGFGFFVFHDHALAGEADEVAGDLDFLLAGEHFQDGADDFRGSSHVITELFFGNATCERVFLLEIGHCTHDELLERHDRRRMHESIADARYLLVAGGLVGRRRELRLDETLWPAGFGNESCDWDTVVTTPRDTRFQNRQCVPARQDFEEGRIPRHPRERSGIENDSAANCDYRRKLTDDEAVSRQKQRGLRELDACEGFFAGRELLFAVKRNLGYGFHGVRVKMDAGAIFQRARG